MYLNVRPPPLRAPWPFSLFFPSRAPPEVHSPVPSPSQPTRGRTNDSSAVSGSPGRRGTTIPPIPPSTNPRGELIFTSRVDKHFKESYERYRAAFEKRRDERVMAEASTTTKLWNWLPSALGGKAAGARKVSETTEKDGKAGDPGARSPLSSANPSRSTTPIDVARIATAR